MWWGLKPELRPRTKRDFLKLLLSDNLTAIIQHASCCSEWKTNRGLCVTVAVRRLFGRVSETHPTATDAKSVAKLCPFFVFGLKQRAETTSVNTAVVMCIM